MAQSATTNFGWQNKFSTTLTSGITSTDTTIPLNALPTPSEGFLVIEPDSSTNWEVIYYTSKTGSAVVCTSVANGRGVDDSTAISHSQGATVRMDTTAGMFEILQNMTAVTAGSAGGIAFASGWTPYPSTTPNTVTALGNRSYSAVFNSVDLTSTLSPGMRLKLTRTVTAPTQCTSLNGTTQYYSKTSPAGMTFTDDFVVSAWVKLTSYTAGTIASRYNGTSGWVFQTNSSGQLQLLGLNAGAANFRGATTYQSLPLNKWVHVAMEIDMSTYTLSATTMYAMFDGVDVPCSLSQGGTNPTALIQAGDLEVGAQNGATAPWPGKIAQVAIYSAKVTQATILASMHQTLAGTETSLISAYSFNGVITDLNANANNLTANGSAVATNADSPFAQGATAGTLEYGIITAASFSTNTTLTVQVPEGSALPTSGGVSALSYSTQKVPYGFPGQRGKWRLATLHRVNANVTSNATYGSYNSNGNQLIVPVGEWVIGHQYGVLNNSSTTAVYYNISPTALTGLTNSTGYDASPFAFKTLSPSAAEVDSSANVFAPVSVTATQTWVLYTLGATTNAGPQGAQGRQEIYAEFDWV